MAENNRTDRRQNRELNSSVVRCERLFKIASSSVAYLVESGIDLETDSFERERYFALFWQQYAYGVLVFEPHNGNMVHSLVDVDQRVSDILQSDSMPWELLEE